MVNRIGIGNFKSIDKLEFELGRFNVFIGENGCGKSNILEAIGMGAAASIDKLDNQFLSFRGVRVVDSKFMRQGFSAGGSDEKIFISIQYGNFEREWHLKNDDLPYSSWISEQESNNVISDEFIELFMNMNLFEKFLKTVNEKNLAGKSDEDLLLVSEKLNDIKEFLKERSDKNNNHNLIFENLKQDISEYKIVSQFIIYSPENSALRAFDKEGQIEPLGAKGEGLFKLLKTLAQTQPKAIQSIAEELQVFDWFESLQLPGKTMSGERYIKVKDRFLDEALDQFDQRSTNEGFLFVLFYLALFISKDTPKFFAIDNIEASLNPKLCRELIAKLNRLSAENGKQVIMTTHSPAVLDGLDLTDDEQRLFVVYRNSEGRTRVRRVMPPTVMAGETEVPLSEAFVRGYLGGLPKNF